MCTQACRCENCYNSAQHDVERQAAVKELLCCSPNAFRGTFTTEVPCVCVCGGGGVFMKGRITAQSGEIF